MIDTVQQVKDRLSILDVVAPYMKLERAGSNFKGRCPFHSERTPSFIVSPSRGTYHCFGCSVGGDIFSFIQEIEGVDFKGALTLLAGKAGVEVVFTGKGAKDEKERLADVTREATAFFVASLTKDHSARKYLHERGMTDETISSFQIGFAPEGWSGLVEHLRAKGFSDADVERAGLARKGDRGAYDLFRSRIMFPIHDAAGRPVAFSGRIFAMQAPRKSVQDHEPPKYINSPETPLFHKSRILYGYDRAKQSMRKHNCAVLVEGQMDLVAAHQAGWSNTIAVSGTALTSDHVGLIMRHTHNLVLALDADEAGIKAAMRSASAALSRGMDVKVARLPQGLDPADLIRKEGADAWRSCVREAKHIVSFLLTVFEETARDRRAFVKDVERSILPFVSTIKSPMDREFFIREVAERAGLSERAVTEALSHTPPQEGESSSRPVEKQREAVVSDQVKPLSPRIRHILGIVFWQGSLPQPILDVEELQASLRDAAGKDLVDEHGKGFSEQDIEKLRFEAEERYGANQTTLKNDVVELIRNILRERLQGELAEATAVLRKAEAQANEDEIIQALERCRTLTEQIAKTGKIG